MQVEAGACGMTCATSDEVVALARAGIGSLLLANVIADPTRLRALAEAAGSAEVMLVIDSHAAAERAAAAARAAGTTLGFLVEIDIGMRRNGVQSVSQAVRLAEDCATLDGLAFQGVQAYEGHLVDLYDRGERRRAVTEAFQPAVELVHALRARGIDVPRLTGSSSATYDASGYLAEMGEVQAGTYVLMDATYRELAPEFVPALAIVCTVTTARRNGEIVIDMGAKRQATDWGLPAWPGGAAVHVGTSEEHTQFQLRSGPLPAVGDRVAVLPAHACTTMAMYRVAFGCREGRLVQELAIDARDPFS
jgi:D-serine deaminase-like pyridoxal phosphate-dependent protein